MRAATIREVHVRGLARSRSSSRAFPSGSGERSTTCSTTPPATPRAHGVVEVTVDADGVRVRDHGTGVDEVDLPYVFDRFYRGANSRGRQGSGLGLAIVRQVAVQHGGSVDVPNAPDGGAIFSLRLPTSRSTPTSRRPGAGRQAVGGASDARLHPRLSSDQEALSQKPEQHREHRATITSSSSRGSGLPEIATNATSATTAGQRRQQDRVRAVAREVLARGDLESPRACRPRRRRSARGPPCWMIPTISADRAGEDRDLRHRQAAERARRTLAVGAQRVAPWRLRRAGAAAGGEPSRRAARGAGTEPRGALTRDCVACATGALSSGLATVAPAYDLLPATTAGTKIT